MCPIVLHRCVWSSANPCLVPLAHRPLALRRAVQALVNPAYTGVFNATAPKPVRMSELCSVLGEGRRRGRSRGQKGWASGGGRGTRWGPDGGVPHRDTSWRTWNASLMRRCSDSARRVGSCRTGSTLWLATAQGVDLVPRSPRTRWRGADVTCCGRRATALGFH